MGGGGQPSSSTKTTIPAELKPLYQQTAKGMMDYQSQNPLTQFSGAHPMQVAPLSANQQTAIGQAGNVGATPEAERLAMTGLAGLPQLAAQRITGESVSNDPAIAAAMNAYKLNTEPGLVNQVKLMGLGNSTAVSNAMSRGSANVMTPLIQASQGREENAINRQVQASEFASGQYQGLGAAERQGRLQQLQALMDTGGTQRDVVQQGNAANQADYLRQQGLSEEALMKPFGAFVPSTLGSTTTTSSGK